MRLLLRAYNFKLDEVVKFFVASISAPDLATSDPELAMQTELAFWRQSKLRVGSRVRALKDITRLEWVLDVMKVVLDPPAGAIGTVSCFKCCVVGIEFDGYQRILTTGPDNLEVIDAAEQYSYRLLLDIKEMVSYAAILHIAKSGRKRRLQALVRSSMVAKYETIPPRFGTK